MAYSVIYASGDGVTDTFAISYPLGFISRSDVTCRVGSEVDGLGNPVYRTLTWITDGLVKVNGTVPPVGINNIAFYRTVSKTSLVHDYADGVAVTESNLDDSNKQVLMAVHEFLDGRGGVGMSISEAVQEAQDAAAAAQAAKSTAQSISDGMAYPVAINKGGTGAVTAAAARTALDVPSNSDMTSAVSGKANIASPTFTGTVTIPAIATGCTAVTQSIADGSTTLATNAYADRAGLGGTSQTWSNVTGSRAFGTTYTNSTGRAIAVLVAATQVSSGQIIPTIGGVALPYVGMPGLGNSVWMTFIVPVSATYKVASTNTLVNWSELR